MKIISDTLLLDLAISNVYVRYFRLSLLIIALLLSDKLRLWREEGVKVFYLRSPLSSSSPGSTRVGSVYRVRHGNNRERPRGLCGERMEEGGIEKHGGSMMCTNYSEIDSKKKHSFIEFCQILIPQQLCNDFRPLNKSFLSITYHHNEQRSLYALHPVCTTGSIHPSTRARINEIARRERALLA